MDISQHEILIEMVQFEVFFFNKCSNIITGKLLWSKKHKAHQAMLLSEDKVMHPTTMLNFFPSSFIFLLTC